MSDGGLALKADPALGDSVEVVCVRGPAATAHRRSDHKGDSAGVLEFWRQEVEQLSCRSFTSDEEAIDAVCEAVLARMEVPSHHRGAALEMLRALFQTDPSLLADLRRLTKRS